MHIETQNYPRLTAQDKLLKCRRTPVVAIEDGTYAKFNTIVKREGITRYAEYGEETVSFFHNMVETAK